MTNQERIERAIELSARIENAKKNTCLTCRYIKRSEWSIGDQCYNPIVMEDAKSQYQYSQPDAVNISAARGARSVCGPDGLLWTKRLPISALQPRYYYKDFSKVGIILGNCFSGSLIFVTVIVNAIGHFVHP